MSQIMPALTLYSEVIACLAAASILSLLVGWMVRKSIAGKQLKARNEFWEKRYAALEEISRVDAENLEERLQAMASDARAMQAKNRHLTESSKKYDTNIQKSRSEAIELNRQHTETKERLQRIIQQKEREILRLGNRVNQSKNIAQSNAIADSNLSDQSDDSTIDDTIDGSEMTYADTVVINAPEMLDATVQVSAQELLVRREQTSGRLYDEDAVFDELESTSAFEDATEAMATEMELDMDEATVALDEEALAHARHSFSSKNKD